MKKAFLALALAACAAVLGGCGDDSPKKKIDPVAFDKHDRCHLCGMVIAHYEGPKAEVFIKGAEDQAIKFCSGRDAFTYALQPENKRRLMGFYIHDMAQTSWDEPEDKALVAADSAKYVYGHTKEGVMGPEPVAFTSESAANEFIKKWGGKVYSYSEVTLELLQQ